MRIIFMGTPFYSVPVIEHLIASGHAIEAVVTRPDVSSGRGRSLKPPAIKVYAEERGIRVLQPASMRSKENLEQLANLQPDLMVVAAYGRILPPNVLALPPKGVLNIHPSLIPQYRGPSPVAAALLNGDKETGVTVMVTEEGMDTGPVVAQKREAVLSGDTTLVLTERLFRIGAELLVKVLPLWEKGQINSLPQDEHMASTTRLYKKEDGFIDWGLSALSIERRLKAFAPWPGCYTYWKGKILKVIEGTAIEGFDGHEPGEIILVPGSSNKAVVIVVTGKGGLELKQVQIEGRRRQNMQDFLLGYNGFVGSRLLSSS
jgi:methionyl-tRNA formyltransferase